MVGTGLLRCKEKTLQSLGWFISGLFWVRPVYEHGCGFLPSLLQMFLLRNKDSSSEGCNLAAKWGLF